MKAFKKYTTSAFLAAVVFCAPTKAQQTVYVPEGWLFGFDYTGTTQGTTQNGGYSIDPTASGTIYGINDRSPSPQGGDFVVGVYQGTGNWVNYFYQGIPLNGLVDAAGSAVSLVDGTSYTANFWMRGNNVYDLFAGGNVGYTFDPTVAVAVRDASNNSIGGVTSTTIAFAPDGWTEVALPFTYSSSMAGGVLTAQINRATVDWNYSTGANSTSYISNTRLGATAFDFVTPVPVPVPEVSASLMLGLGSLLVLAGRKRRS